MWRVSGIAVHSRLRNTRGYAAAVRNTRMWTTKWTFVWILWHICTCHSVSVSNWTSLVIDSNFLWHFYICSTCCKVCVTTLEPQCNAVFRRQCLIHTITRSALCWNNSPRHLSNSLYCKCDSNGDMNTESIQCQYMVLVMFKERIDCVGTSDSWAECMQYMLSDVPGITCWQLAAVVGLLMVIGRGWGSSLVTIVNYSMETTLQGWVNQFIRHQHSRLWLLKSSPLKYGGPCSKPHNWIRSLLRGIITRLQCIYYFLYFKMYYLLLTTWCSTVLIVEFVCPSFCHVCTVTKSKSLLPTFLHYMEGQFL